MPHRRTALTPVLKGEPVPVRRAAQISQVEAHLRASVADPRPPVLVFTAISGSGKTTLLEQLGAELRGKTPRAVIDCAEYAPTEIPELLAEAKFQLGQHCPGLGRLQFRRLELGLAVSKEEIDFTDQNEALRKIRELIRTFLFRVPRRMADVVGSTAGDMFASLTQLPVSLLRTLVERLSIAVVTRVLSSPPFIRRAQDWYGHRHQGLPYDSVYELATLNRWAQDPDKYLLRDKRLVEALLADLRSAFGHGKRPPGVAQLRRPARQRRPRTRARRPALPRRASGGPGEVRSAGRAPTGRGDQHGTSHRLLRPPQATARVHRVRHRPALLPASEGGGPPLVEADPPVLRRVPGGGRAPGAYRLCGPLGRRERDRRPARRQQRPVRTRPRTPVARGVGADPDEALGALPLSRSGDRDPDRLCRCPHSAGRAVAGREVLRRHAGRCRTALAGRHVGQGGTDRRARPPALAAAAPSGRSEGEGPAELDGRAGGAARPLPRERRHRRGVAPRPRRRRMGGRRPTADRPSHRGFVAGETALRHQCPAQDTGTGDSSPYEHQIHLTRNMAGRYPSHLVNVARVASGLWIANDPCTGPHRSPLYEQVGRDLLAIAPHSDQPQALHDEAQRHFELAELWKLRPSR